MPAGIVIYNDSGTVQIDATFKNLSLALKGTLVTGTKSDGSFHYNDQHVDIVYTANSSTPPMLAVLGDYMGFMVLLSRSGNTFTWRAVLPTAPGAASVNYWIFDKPPNNSNSKFGLQVWDESGNLCFDALYRYAKVVGTLTTPVTGSSPPSASFPIPSGRTYIAVQNDLGQYAVSVPISNPGQPPSFAQQLTIVGIKRQGQQLMTEHTFRSYGPLFSPKPTTFNDAAYLILDVTGF